MIAGALFGANRVAFVLDMLDGRDPASLQTPQEAMIEEFSRIGESIVPDRFKDTSKGNGSGRNRAGTARFRTKTVGAARPVPTPCRDAAELRLRRRASRCPRRSCARSTPSGVTRWKRSAPRSPHPSPGPRRTR